jgi:hypothetical protein
MPAPITLCRCEYATADRDGDTDAADKPNALPPCCCGCCCWCWPDDRLDSGLFTAIAWMCWDGCRWRFCAADCCWTALLLLLLLVLLLLLLPLRDCIMLGASMSESLLESRCCLSEPPLKVKTNEKESIALDKKNLARIYVHGPGENIKFRNRLLICSIR